jgi:glycosyltransferase involved in cell wall biosynthesis
MFLCHGLKEMMDVPEQPSVCVVIPSLNRANYLEPTIESILQQSYPHIECIVVDGGSTDGTIEILESYGITIRWISEPDNGHADAINRGWKMSQAQILSWLNADDLWAVPNAVSAAVESFQNHPEADVIYGKCGAIDEAGNQVGMSYLHEWELHYAVEFNDHCIPQPASFIRRRILDRVGYLNESFYVMDKELWWRIGLHGTIMYVPELFAYARNTPGKIHDGNRMAKDCVQVAKHFYSLAGVTPALLEKKNRAISNAYVRGADYATLQGQHLWIIAKYTLLALVADLSNKSDVMHKFRDNFLAALAEKCWMPRIWIRRLQLVSVRIEAALRNSRL